MITATRYTRAERLAQVQELRALGLSGPQIAARLDIKLTSVRGVLNDPTGSKQRARRERYKGTCEQCGRATSSNGTSQASKHCRSCAAKLQKIWSRERIIDAIQRFAAVHGRPPGAREWMHTDRANDYPSSSAVYGSPSAIFPLWADAIEAAGFLRPRPGIYANTVREAVCGRCGTEFIHSSHGGRSPSCPDCRAALARERNKRQNDAYYAAHKEEIAARGRRYYQENKQRLRARSRAYQAAHREELAPKRRAASRAYYQRNKQQISERNRARYLKRKAARDV